MPCQLPLHHLSIQTRKVFIPILYAICHIAYKIKIGMKLKTFLDRYGNDGNNCFFVILRSYL